MVIISERPKPQHRSGSWPDGLQRAQTYHGSGSQPDGLQPPKPNTGQALSLTAFNTTMSSVAGAAYVPQLTRRCHSRLLFLDREPCASQRRPPFKHQPRAEAPQNDHGQNDRHNRALSTFAREPLAIFRPKSIKCAVQVNQAQLIPGSWLLAPTNPASPPPWPELARASS
jgi:hypothetical protein